MADQSVQQIQQRLTCPVCLDRYKQPKLLPCQHSFCLTPCLVNLVDRVTRRVKCPECRVVHPLPVQGGVDGFPNNITIMRFLDLDLERLNETTQAAHVSDICAQCGLKQPNGGGTGGSFFFRCLDCEKFFCSNCKTSHSIQLQNEIKQLVYNLRRSLPKLSQNVGSYEQKKTSINQNFESLKREISSTIAKLVEDLRDRERCLIAEAEVYMQAQIRTIGLENENAEIELATVSSFCDSTEATLNREEEIFENNNNNISILKKQCLNFLSQTNNLTEQSGSINKLILTIPNMVDFSHYIRTYGSLTVVNRDTQEASNQQQQSMINNSLYTNPPARNNNNNSMVPQRRTQSPQFARPTQHDYFSNMQSAGRNNRSERPIYGGGGGGGMGGAWSYFEEPPSRARRVPSPVSFNVHPSQTYPSRNDRNVIASNNPTTSNATNELGLVRSSTFVIESSREEPRPTRSVDITEFYNVQRRPRAKTPMTFNVMFDEPLNAIEFDNHDTATVNNDTNNNNNELTSSPGGYWPTPAQPKINYASKKKPRLVIGKSGREYGEFAWPLDVAVNTFNGQLLVADSNNHRIQVFEPGDGRFVRSFGRQGAREGQFDCIDGIFVDSMSNIFVVDRLNHRIQLFDRYFRFVRTIGSGPGNAPGKLNYPWGIAVNRISEIFVCDKENDRVCVFHFSGRFLRSFGSHGSGDGQFDKPYYIHITRDNKCLVSDSSNHRIQVFDSNGLFLFKFGREGSAPGELKSPRGVTTDTEGFVLVADAGNSRVQVYRGDGTFVCAFGSAGSEPGRFRGIEALAVVHKTGELIVCDKENNRVQIF